MSNPVFLLRTTLGGRFEICCQTLCTNKLCEMCESASAGRPGVSCAFASQNCQLCHAGSFTATRQRAPRQWGGWLERHRRPRQGVRWQEVGFEPYPCFPTPGNRGATFHLQRNTRSHSLPSPGVSHSSRPKLLENKKTLTIFKTSARWTTFGQSTDPTVPRRWGVAKKKPMPEPRVSDTPFVSEWCGSNGRLPESHGTLNPTLLRSKYFPTTSPPPLLPPSCPHAPVDRRLFFWPWVGFSLKPIVSTSLLSGRVPRGRLTRLDNKRGSLALRHRK